MIIDSFVIGLAQKNEIRIRVDIDNSEERTSGLDVVQGGAPSYGTIRYVHALGIDAPVAVLDSRFADARVLHYNWRGLAEASSWTTGSPADCQLMSGSCTLVAWPAGQGVYYRRPSDPYAGMTRTWIGSLPSNGQDGTGMLCRRNRYYDPAAGRFTQEDPIGLAGGLNLYGFAEGDPVNFSDPFGLRPCPGPSSSFPCRLQAAVDSWKASIARLGASVLAFVGEASGVAPAMRSGGFPNPDGSQPSAGQRVVDGLLAASALVPGDEALSVGGRIARGHAWGSHADEFASLGIRSADDFGRHIDNVIQGGEARTLSRGRTAYWDEATGTVVIHDVRAGDLGTAFRPTNGRAYFDNLK